MGRGEPARRGEPLRRRGRARARATPRTGSASPKPSRRSRPRITRERYQLQERAHGRRLYRLSARHDAPRRGARRSRCSARSTPCAEDWRPALNAYAASLKLADEPAVRTTYEELREKHGFRITDYKVDSDSASPRVCFQFSEPLAAGQGRLRALRRGLRRRQRRRHGRGLAALRRRAEARRALRLRAAPGPAVVRRREPAEVGGLRGLCPRPLAAGALHRPQLRPAAHRPGGHPGRLGQHADGRGRDLPHRRPQPPADRALRGLPRPAHPLPRPRRSRPRRA